MTSTKRNIIANFVGRGWSGVITLIFMPVYISLMGIEAYGLVGIYLSLFAVLFLLDLGLSTTLNRELAKLSARNENVQQMRNLVRTLELIYWVTAVLIGVCIVLLAPLITHYWIKADKLSVDTIQQAIILMGIAIALQWPFALYSGGLMGLQRQVLLNGITASMNTARAVGAVLVLWLVEPSIQVFFLWQILISSVQTALTGAALWYALPKSHAVAKFKKDLLHSIWRFAAGMTGISVLAVILTQSDKVILSKMLTLEMFGYYSLAWVVAGGFAYFISPFFTALFPRFSQLVTLKDEQTLKELYHQACQLLSVVILPLATVVALFSEDILILWTQDVVVTKNTHLVLSLLIIGTAANGLMNLPYAIQIAYGWTKLPFYTNLVATLILIPFIFIAATYYGAVGAATAWIILNLGYILINLQVMHRRLLKGELWQWYKKDVGLPLVAALIIPSLCKWLIIMPSSSFFRLTILSGILILTYIATTLMAPKIRGWVISRLSRNRFRRPLGDTQD